MNMAPSAMEVDPMLISVSRAFVSGGGGVAGIAWQTGLLAVLATEGVNLSQADLIVGNSAGATVAAQITGGRTLQSLYEDQRDGTCAREPVIKV